jgi:hypothetical protein
VQLKKINPMKKIGSLIMIISLLSPVLKADEPNAFGVPEVVLTGVVGSQLIKEFDEAGKRLITQGENSGQALITSLGNQIRVSIENARLAMEGQQNVAFENLDKRLRGFFTTLNGMLRQSSSDINRAVKILEVANLNLIEITNQLPLTNKVLTYINKIDGLMQPHQRVPYQIRISGLGMGQDYSDKTYKTTIKIGGKTLPPSMMYRQPPYDMTLLINPEFLESFFDDNQMKFVPIVVETTVDYEETCALFFSCDETLKSTWNLRLVLLPRFPGRLEGYELIKGDVLDEQVKTTSISVTTQGCKSDSPCDWSREILIPDNARVTAVRYGCAGQCGWSYNLRHGGYDPDFDILQGKVVVYRHVDAGSPTTVTYYVDYQTLKPEVRRRPIQPIKLEFGKTFQVPLSADNTSCSYQLKARLTTGQEIFLDNSMQQSPDGLLVCIGSGNGPAGTTCTPSFTLNLP